MWAPGRRFAANLRSRVPGALAAEVCLAGNPRAGVDVRRHMSRPVDSRLNRSGFGQLSETDQKPPEGQDTLLVGEHVGSAPAEQSPGHDHDNPDVPDHVHEALRVPEAASDPGEG